MSIKYAPDGNSLIDNTGSIITVFDARYGPLRAILSAQDGTVAENKTAADHYKYLVGEAQSNIDRGLPYAALPDKPRQKVIDDTGSVSYVAFTPSLPDVVIPAPTAPPVPGGLMGAMVAAGAGVPDRNAIMQNQVDAMFRKAFPGVTP